MHNTVSRGVRAKLVLKANGQDECVDKNSTHWGDADEGGWVVLDGGEGRTSLQRGANLELHAPMTGWPPSP